ncbi:nephrin isoform X1 [Solea solea]|uniref:nephrin isoform X1 n=1 Tax=Solea solea TaxID=90069 RepID=UPI00272B1A01|nr:nephrin isoform X1 [Solea solea]XP_058502724.1 nephrin isoform X1 [Solea solea]XP_058502725.1 nephrin isoform X1 [Solea solea]
MDFFSAWIVSFSALHCLYFFWGTQAQQAFRTEPRNLTVRMGATAVLRCEVLRASGTVQWVKDGLLLGPHRSLPGFPRYSMIGNPKRGQHNLQIEKAQLDDDTTYECQAGQSESSRAIVSNTAWLNVLIPPSTPYFEGDVATTPWIAGKMYTVACVAPEAKPMAEITLYKDGVELTGAESFTMSGSKDKLLNTHAKVTVAALSSDNGRQLACYAKNPALLRPVGTVLTMSVLYPPHPPVIVGLETDEVKAGRVLILECVSHGGNPLATLHWTKNGEVLSKTWEEDIVAQKSSSVLYLKITPADNQAELCCESVNLVSLSPLSVHRKFTVLFEPEKVILSGSVEAVEGQELDLCCYASSSNPPVQIRWWLGYKELNNTVVTIQKGVNGGMTTTANMTHQVSREEDGLMLTCEAFNKGTHFSKTQTAKLSVFYPPQKVWLDAPSQDVPLHAGTKVRLTCFSTGGNPTGTLTWFKDGNKVSHMQRQMSFDRGVARDLVLVLTASDNMADYRCDATNEAKKTISAYTKLMVYYTAVSMKITTTQEELRRGEMLTLECQAGSSNPKANILWSLGTQRFPGVEQPPVKAQYGGVSVRSSLSLNLTSEHHNQRVICQANSPVLAEGANTFLKLNVLYPPEFSPHQPTQVQVLEDDTITIPLLVSANPEEVSCNWLHRKQKLVKEGNLRYHWSDEHSLMINNVTRKDAGVYTVECANHEGVNQISIMLDVQYAPGVKAVKSPVFVNMGGTADLMCKADANPIISDMFSWKWLGEEEEVEMGEETQEDKTGLLTIHDVTRAHAGFYQCTANNGIAPPASVDVHLVVQFKPELQKGPQWRKVASRGDGTTTAAVVCQAEGIPQIDFSWEKKGVPMDFANPRYEERTVREGSFHTSTVRVVNVSAAHDYAVFSCTARNSLGEDKLNIQLVSTSRPDPPFSFRQVSVTHDSVTLEWIPGFNGGLQQRFRTRYRWDQSFSYLYVDVFPPTATSFSVTGLQPVTTYYFSVNSLNAMGESDYADNNAVLTITTKERPELEETSAGDDSVPHGTRGLPAHLTVVFTVVFGVLLVLNSLGCFFGQRWKKRRLQKGGGGGSVLDGKENEEEGSSQSTVNTSNKYESREKINAAAQRTLLVESGSEADGNVYESYAAEGSHYYFPTTDYVPALSPHPEEMRRHDASHLPVDSHSHVYEDVRLGGLYQDILASSPSPVPLVDRTVPYQWNNWRSPTNLQQGAARVREFGDVQQPRRDSDLPFELRGELV